MTDLRESTTGLTSGGPIQWIGIRDGGAMSTSATPTFDYGAIATACGFLPTLMVAPAVPSGRMTDTVPLSWLAT